MIKKPDTPSRLTLLNTSAETAVFRPDEEIASVIREHITELASLIQEAKERSIIVTFNIGDDSRQRMVVTALEIVKKTVL